MDGGELGASHGNGIARRIGRLNERRRLALAALVVAPLLAALAVLLFDVIREIPPQYGCGDERPNGQDAALATYRRGSVIFHATTMICAFAGLLLLMPWRRIFAHESRLRLAVTVALGIAVLALASALVYVLSILVAVGIVSVAHPLGPKATGAIAVLLLAAGTLVVASKAIADRWLVPGGWLVVLFVLTSGHWLVVTVQGSGPIVC